MPFGAELRPEGGVRFRLWAPGANQVKLGLEGSAGERCLPMQRLDGGWYELVTADAGPGSLYRFHLDAGLQVPDPASRFNPKDVHRPSEVVDPAAYAWQDASWRGRPCEETVATAIIPPGGRRSTSTAKGRARYATFSSTMPSTGWRNTISTACARMQCTRSWTTPRGISWKSWPRWCIEDHGKTAAFTWCWRTARLRIRPSIST